MADTLAVAVSQSGTTTDTNRTVDLLRGRGAAVLAIVNRRSSDLTEKADGVLYTSRRSRRGDERGVDEGVLRPGRRRRAAGLRHQRGRRRGHGPAPPRAADVAARDARRRCARCSSRREVVADAARRFAPTKRYWAVVGSGVNKVAAEEVRIKLSELCYKSIACDVIEDKKHIDLSSRAADPRVRRRPGREHGRRRRQGDRHLPGPQGDADRDRRRRRRALRRRRR